MADICFQLASDSELSVKNGAELLDRLVKDIVAESAASYVSVLQISEKEDPNDLDETELPTAFSLAKFIPLLKERIHVIGPYTRNFLVSWLTLLDTIPDLELVTYLPEFLEGLIKFLGGPNKDVNVATQGLLDRFLSEIKRITILKKGIEESRKGQESRRRSATSDNGSLSTKTETIDEPGDKDDIAVDDSASGSLFEDEVVQADGDWIPGQDVQIDYTKILDILVSFVDTSYGMFLDLFIHTCLNSSTARVSDTRFAFSGIRGESFRNMLYLRPFIIVLALQNHGNQSRRVVPVYGGLD